MTVIKFDKHRFHQNPQMYEWLINNFGEGGWYRDALNDYRWSWESAFGTTRYYFKYEKDATLFALRWA